MPKNKIIAILVVIVIFLFFFYPKVVTKICSECDQKMRQIDEAKMTQSKCLGFLYQDHSRSFVDGPTIVYCYGILLQIKN